MKQNDPMYLIDELAEQAGGWLYPEFCVNSALDVKQSKIFTRRHCNSRPPL